MSTPRILLVEDSRDDEELALLALRDAGIDADVHVARDGEEALHRLATQPEGGFRLVVLDLKIPKIDGFEVLRRIRGQQTSRYVPVVVFTSSDVPSDIDQAYELGANAYVCKPVEFGEYSDVVRQIGKFWTCLNRTMQER